MATPRLYRQKSGRLVWRLRWRVKGVDGERQLLLYCDALRLLEGLPSGTQPSYSSDAERVRRNVTVTPAGCWEWNLYRSPDGYGYLTARGTSLLAHRVSYETLVGPIPEGLQIDHLCRNRACVNPEHLEPVTPRTNVLRSPIAQAALNAAKTHCPQNHPYDEANTYVAPRTGTRLCRACMKARYAAQGASR